MKKILTLAFCAFSAFLFFGCGSTSAIVTQEQKPKDSRPEWIEQGKKNTILPYATGKGKLTNDEASINLAKSQARLALLQPGENFTKGVIQTFIDQKEDENEKQRLLKILDNSAIMREVIFNASEIEEQYKDTDRTIYVLLTTPKDRLLKELVKVAKLFNPQPSDSSTEEKMSQAYDKYVAENSLK